MERPEIVAKNETAIGADGTVRVEIDTAQAKALHGDTDHEYQITAEVTDQSRRTIVGTAAVLVARKPFKVYAWLDSGYYQTGDDIRANFQTGTLDKRPIKGAGLLKLLRVTYKDGNPIETEVQHWNLNTDDHGTSQQQIKADQPGQYRLSYAVTDAFGHTIEGGCLFIIRGQGFDGRDFRFNDIELITDKKEYRPGDTVRLLINTNRADSTVLLFTRPVNGVYQPPTILHINGKSAIQEIGVVQGDMPNFFVEALTVSNGRVHDEVREIIVPPENKVLNVEVLPSAVQNKPGDKATIKFKVTGLDGKPVAGSSVVALYDKSVEYISGDSNVTSIVEAFWGWRRAHEARTETNLRLSSDSIHSEHEVKMERIGAGFDQYISESMFMNSRSVFAGAGGREAPRQEPVKSPTPKWVEPAVRKNFVDTAVWAASVVTGADGVGQVDFTLPENLTTWKAKVWTMADGTRVGEGTAEVVTRKSLIVRLQALDFSCRMMKSLSRRMSIII